MDLSIYYINKDIKIIYKYIDELLEKNNYVIIFIDGFATSGKTSLALNELKEKYNLVDKIDIIHIDDFYLPKSNKDNIFNNLDKIDIYLNGNIDYFRFNNEVSNNLNKLLKSKTISSFKYGIFSCKEQKISEEIIVDIKNKSRLTIIEGTYSFSRNINLNSDLDIFLILTKEEELERLKIRENESNYNNFLNIWMKLERNYFSSLKPKNNDLILFKCSKEDASISNES